MAIRKMPRANVAVALDQPLFPVKPTTSTTSILLAALERLMVSNVFRLAVLTFCLGFGYSVVTRRSVSDLPPIPKLSTFLKVMRGKLTRVKETVKKEKKEGVPMTFDSETNQGWGVCTLRSKKRLGKSSFVQYDFDLPKADNVLHLDLGQQISMCCLDNSHKVAKGDFYLYHTQNHKLGVFSILAPNRAPAENKYAVGKDAANFVRVLKEELKVGDEVALQPGPRKLSYRGQYLPVTDMIYIASGVGIVPVMEQVKAVLPSGSSSVKSVSIVWVNDNTKDFDVISEELEKEYFKYTTKLAVSCIVDDLRKNDLGENKEIKDAIPDFRPGAMAVVAGPQQISEKARAYLISEGYPQDCICTL